MRSDGPPLNEIAPDGGVRSPWSTFVTMTVQVPVVPVYDMVVGEAQLKVIPVAV